MRDTNSLNIINGLNNIMKKLFVVQKYIVARTISEALKIEKHTKPDECWLDDDWKKAHKPEMGNKSLGFTSKK